MVFRFPSFLCCLYVDALDRFGGNEFKHYNRDDNDDAQQSLQSQFDAQRPRAVGPSIGSSPQRESPGQA